MTSIRSILISLVAAAAPGAASAAIGDSYVRVVYCSGTDGGEYVWYGAGTCPAAEAVLASFGHVLKSCEQLVVVGGGTIGPDYGDILDDPFKTIFSGNLVNIGQAGQGVVIVWRPDGLPHAARFGLQGIELAPLPLSHAPNGSDLEIFIFARAGGPTRWIDDTIIQGIQGDFEIIYETASTGTTPDRAAFNISSLQFVPARLPCNQADLSLQHDVLDLQDINAFVNGFTTSDPAVDLNGDLLLDLVDINLFVTAFLGGCP
ncbi:MAG: hypothetical protein K8E66_06910 [Phycisphaerales bacterium]|nr:hypothetical protein [Phycisphaerales bacterium]